MPDRHPLTWSNADVMAWLQRQVYGTDTYIIPTAWSVLNGQSLDGLTRCHAPLVALGALFKPECAFWLPAALDALLKLYSPANMANQTVPEPVLIPSPLRLPPMLAASTSAARPTMPKTLALGCFAGDHPLTKLTDEQNHKVHAYAEALDDKICCTVNGVGVGNAFTDALGQEHVQFRVKWSDLVHGPVSQCAMNCPRIEAWKERKHLSDQVDHAQKSACHQAAVAARMACGHAGFRCRRQKGQKGSRRIL